MKYLLQKFLTLMLCASFLMSSTAFAQTIDATSSSTAPVATESPVSTSPATTTESVPQPAQPAPLPEAAIDQPAASSTINQTIELQGTSPVQDTVNTQVTASSSVLENTTDPNTATTSDATSTPISAVSSSTPVIAPVPVPSSSVPAATPLVASTTADAVVAQVATAQPIPESEPPPTPTPITAPKIIEIPLHAAPERPDYTFALTGKSIPATRSIENNDGVVTSEETVAAPLTSTVDNVTGQVTVSGQCSAEYYVVLLFKNATDYLNDRRSYIVNRAYKCVGGSFTYSIKDLPSTLEDGNYYLLVGEESATGTWKPITGLREITINKNQ